MFTIINMGNVTETMTFLQSFGIKMESVIAFMKNLIDGSYKGPTGSNLVQYVGIKTHDS